MKMNFNQILQIHLKIENAQIINSSKDLLGRCVHLFSVENHKTIKSIRVLADAENITILKVFNNTNENNELLWQQRASYTMETKFLMADLIKKIKKQSISVSIEENFENSPYRVKVSFLTSKDSHQIENYLNALGEGSKIAYKAINERPLEYEAIPTEKEKLMLYESSLGVSDVSADLIRMGFVHD